MSKILKLLNNPSLFFTDAVRNRVLNSNFNKEKTENIIRIAKESEKARESEQSIFYDIFNIYPTSDFLRRMNTDKPKYLYLPWIMHHGDVLIGEISNNKKYDVVEFDLIKIDTYNIQYRRKAARYIRENTSTYLNLLLSRLIPIRKDISGFLLTFDWDPIMRIIVEACNILEIPTILIPHESVFADKDKFYRDMVTNASVPKADYILGWGDIQQSIFKERGFNVDDRFEAVGALKFDRYLDYKPNLKRKQFCQVFGFDPDKKICLFSAQPLDNQFASIKIAREAQRKSILDIHKKCLEINAHILVRMPPSGDMILNREIKDTFSYGGICAVDTSPNYLVSPSESIYHSDVVISINSTMLFEAILMGRPSISTKYTSFDPMWQPLGVPTPDDYESLSQAIDSALSHAWCPSEQGMEWAAKSFGTGVFDGKATERVCKKLALWANETSLSKAPTPFMNLLNDAPIDVVAISSSQNTLKSTQKNLRNLIRCNTLVSSRLREPSESKFSAVDIFMQWGAVPNTYKKNQSKIARSLHRPIVYLEDGFIRSLGLGVIGDPSHSIILDDISPYYDARIETRLQKLLQNSSKLSKENEERCRSLIKKIVHSKISKYNHAPSGHFEIGNPGRPKILLVDQRFGDASVDFGLAGEETFDKMLFEAIMKYPEYDIIVKLHPDATSGEKSSYFNQSRLSKFDNFKNVFTVKFEINPYCLLELVEKVFVCTSLLGFEALMAGKEVHCFGVPFYSNRGLTVDHQNVEYRSKDVSLYTLFYYTYIYLSRYVHPDTGVRCSLEELIECFGMKTKM